MTNSWFERVRPFRLAVSRIPPILRMTSQAAATADGGALDAALVRVDNATITDTATVAGDVVLTVDDGSGAMEIVLDRDVGFILALLGPTVVIDATGLLVPTGSGSWQLKPRSRGDLVLQR